MTPFFHALTWAGRQEEVLQTGLRLLFPLASLVGFFNNLYGQLSLFGGSVAIFFLALAGLLYSASVIFASERARSAAVLAIYGALIGLAVLLLAPTIAGIVTSAAKGQ